MNEQTRRDFLKLSGLGLTSLALRPVGLTAAPPTDGFTLVQLCDTQLGFGGYEHDVACFRQAVQHINTLQADFVCICGDLVNKADKPSYADFRTIRDGLHIPCHCVPGNHDVGNKPTAATLRRYRTEIGEDYYTFEHKGCAFVFVNTQLWKTPLKGESEKHDAWFASTLEQAAEKKMPIFVFGHHPIFLKKPDEPDQYYNLPLAKRQELLRLFETHGVVAMLAGHTHKLIVNTYKGIQLVNGETTSKNFDGHPMGMRVWHVEDPRPYKHEFHALNS